MSQSANLNNYSATKETSAMKDKLANIVKDFLDRMVSKKFDILEKNVDHQQDIIRLIC